MLRGVIRQSPVVLGLFDPVYDKNAGGSHTKRRDTLPAMGSGKAQQRQWNATAQKLTMRRVPYSGSSIAELVADAEEAVPSVNRDFLEPRQRRYVNRLGLMLLSVSLSLYFFTIWRFGQEVFDDVVIPDFSDESGKSET